MSGIDPAANAKANKIQFEMCKVLLLHNAYRVVVAIIVVAVGLILMKTLTRTSRTTIGSADCTCVHRDIICNK